jgi:hypothetical protein
MSSIGSAEDLAAVEVGEDRHHVLAARCRGIAQSRRRQWRATREVERLRFETLVRRCFVGKVVVEEHDPTGPLELADPDRRDSRDARGIGQRRRARDREGAKQPVNRGYQARIGIERVRSMLTGQRDGVPIADESPLTDEGIDERRRGARRLVATQGGQPA